MKTETIGKNIQKVFKHFSLNSTGRLGDVLAIVVSPGSGLGAAAEAATEAEPEGTHPKLPQTGRNETARQDSYTHTAPRCGSNREV